MKKGRFLGLTELGLGLNGAMQTGFYLMVSSSPDPEGGALAAELELPRLLLGKPELPRRQEVQPPKGNTSVVSGVPPRPLCTDWHPRGPSTTPRATNT